jgi:anti-sigma factor RsiW
MNDPTIIGPCVDFEHDLVDLHDGALAPERACSVRQHVEQCPRCRAWQAEFAALDARLAAGLPRPGLSPAFDEQLRARLAALSRSPPRGDLRTALEREHESLVSSLRRGARRQALLGAVASAAATLCVLALGHSLLARGIDLLSPLAGGTERWIALGALGAGIALATLAWSAGRDGPPTLGRLR